MNGRKKKVNSNMLCHKGNVKKKESILYIALPKSISLYSGMAELSNVMRQFPIFLLQKEKRKRTNRFRKVLKNVPRAPERPTINAIRGCFWR